MKMNYFVFGTNKLEQAVAFYEALFAGSALKKVHVDERMTVWSDNDFMFAIARPFDGDEATVGNGTMLGLNLGSAAEVDRLYALAIASGGSDEGAPAPRVGRHSAYVRDLDGNKICLFE